MNTEFYYTNRIDTTTCIAHGSFIDFFKSRSPVSFKSPSEGICVLNLGIEMETLVGLWSREKKGNYYLHRDISLWNKNRGGESEEEKSTTQTYLRKYILLL